MFLNTCVKGQINLFLWERVIFPPTAGTLFPSSLNEVHNLKFHADMKKDATLAFRLQYPSHFLSVKCTKYANPTDRIAKETPLSLCCHPTKQSLPAQLQCPFFLAVHYMGRDHRLFIEQLVSPQNVLSWQRRDE